MRQKSARLRKKPLSNAIIDKRNCDKEKCGTEGVLFLSPLRDNKKR